MKCKVCLKTAKCSEVNEKCAELKKSVKRIALFASYEEVRANSKYQLSEQSFNGAVSLPIPV